MAVLYFHKKLNEMKMVSFNISKKASFLSFVITWARRFCSCGASMFWDSWENWDQRWWRWSFLRDPNAQDEHSGWGSQWSWCCCWQGWARLTNWHPGNIGKNISFVHFGISLKNFLNIEIKYQIETFVWKQIIVSS